MKLGNTDALKYSGVIYLESGNPQKAILKLKSYLDNLDSEHEDRKITLNDLGLAYFKNNDIQNAKLSWEKASA